MTTVPGSERLLFIGNGPFSNHGCEAIIRGTIRILNKSFDQPKFINMPCASAAQITSDRSFKTGSIKDLLEIPLPPRSPKSRWSLKGIMFRAGARFGPFPFGFQGHQDFMHDFAKYLDNFDVALQVGGDNFSFDYYGYGVSYMAMNKVLARKGIPVVIWGASVGPFSSKPFSEKWVIKQLHKDVKIILVREPASFEYLTKKGLGKKTYLVGDPAFVMESLLPVNKDLQDINGGIGINLSPLLGNYINKNNGTCWAKEAAKIIKKIKHITNKLLVLIPHVVPPYESDYEFLKYSLKIAGLGENEVLLLPPTLNAPELKWIISKLDLLIAARMHAAIAAFSSCVPTICIAYSVKAKGISRQIFGSEKYIISTKELNEDVVLEKVQEVLDLNGEIRDELGRVIPSIQQKAFQAGDILKEFIASQNE